MTAKHTPAPWIIVNDALVRGPHGEPIASTKGFAYPFDTNYKENAIIIAAAPDMAEFITKWKRQIQFFGYVTQWAATFDAEAEAALKQAGVL